MLRAWDHLYSAFLDEAPHGLIDIDATRNELLDYLGGARRLLTSQRDELTLLLKQYELDDCLDTPYRGGLFLLAKLASKRDDLARQSSLLINSGNWSRTDQWSRLCFSLPPDRWKIAIERLRNFLSATNW
jgi:hypothetical protein